MAAYVPLTRNTIMKAPTFICAIEGDSILAADGMNGGFPRTLHASQVGGSLQIGSGFWSFFKLSPIGRPYAITGVTKDIASTPIANCTVDVFYTGNGDDPPIWQGRTTSDGSGNYSWPVTSPAYEYRAIAYILGSPDKAGTTTTEVVGS